MMSLDQVVAKILVQQQEAAERQQQAADRQQLLFERLTTMMAAGPQNQNQAHHEAPIADVVAKSIIDFRYAPEEELYFSQWYARYEEHFAQDAKLLDDQSKVRILLRKLSPQVYQRYVDYILPEKPTQLSLKDNVAKLKTLFDRQDSLFSRRYKCLQVTKSNSEDIIAYSARVNKLCENFLFNNLEIDQFKCLIFVLGLQSHEQADIRKNLLKLLDKDAETTTMDKLVKETQRLQALKHDTKLIEEPQVSTFVNAVTSQAQAHSSQLPKQYQRAKYDKNINHSDAPKRPCWNCGGMHFVKNCNFAQHKCSMCYKVGHKEGYCSCVTRDNSKANKSKKQANYRSHTVVSQIKHTHTGLRKYISIIISHKILRLQYDTASDLTIISNKNWAYIGSPKLSPCEDSASDASRNKIPIMGQFTTKVHHNNREVVATIIVTTLTTLNVFGIDLISSFGYWDEPVSMVCKSIASEEKSLYDIVKLRYPEILLPGVGHCTGVKIKLHLKENVTPIFKAKRPVPYASLAAVETEINRLTSNDIITPVTHSDWAAPVVIVKKANGKIRICGDYSTGLNDAMELNKYPIPTADEIFAKLNQCKIFTKIDLSDAYLQFEIDDESKKMLTIHTHKGLFNFNRLPPGVTSAPGAFQQTLDVLLAGIEGVATYLDDLIIATKTIKENKEVLMKVFDRFKNCGLRINWPKCELLKTKITYLGHVIDEKGIHPDPRKVEAVRHMSTPTNVSELRSFLGAINYYGKFIPQMRILRHPLDELLKTTVKWNWDEKCELAFKNFKEILTSDLSLTNYDPTLPIVVAADASIVGIGAQIFHKFTDGTEKAIYYAARALTPTEKRYSQIEKEALALVYACTKFHRMIYGRSFTLLTDHKPLLAIFGNNKGIPTHTANRLQRWALVLMAYDFKIKYVNTKEFGNVDVLSRLIKAHRQEEEDYVIAKVNVEEDVQQILEIQLSNIPVTRALIQQTTAKDPLLCKITKFIQEGWTSLSSSSEILTADVKPFYNRRDGLSIVDGCIVTGERVVIPSCYQTKIIKQLHQGHPGIEKMKALARSYVYWPRLDADIAEYVKNCENCSLVAKSPRKVELSSWSTPQQSMQRVHMDIFGPVRDKYYLIIVDAYSKWPEVCQLSSLSAQEITMHFHELISRYGQPETVVTDNGTQFTSEIFTNFCVERGICHLRSAPYHPQSNGQAERFVDTIKRALKKAYTETSTNDKENLNIFLAQYRATPNVNSPGGKSPAELFIGRKLKTSLDLLTQQTVNIEKNLKMQQQFNNKHGAIQRNFAVGEKVYVKTYKNNKMIWAPGQVMDKIGTVMYGVRVEGQIRRVHANQLRNRYSSVENDPNNNHNNISNNNNNNNNNKNDDNVTIPEQQQRKSGRKRQIPKRLQD